MLEKSMELPFLLCARLDCARASLPIQHRKPAGPIHTAPMTVFIRSSLTPPNRGNCSCAFIDERFLPKPSARRQPAGFFSAHAASEDQSEQLSVPKGGFGKFHSKRLPESVMQVRVCGALAASVDGLGGGAKARLAQGEETAAPAVAPRITRQPVIH
jgi:hypothetical protein